MIVLFSVESLLVPLLLMVRFLILSPVSLLSPRCADGLPSERPLCRLMSIQARND